MKCTPSDFSFNPITSLTINSAIIFLVQRRYKKIKYNTKLKYFNFFHVLTINYHYKVFYLS